MATTDIVFTWTEDNLKLQGVHFPSDSKDLCVLLIHGMSGNYVDNYFGHVVGETLQKNNVGFIFAHNRGSFHINDLEKRLKNEDGSTKFERVGVMYERFEECIFDIDAWLSEARRLGYKKFVLIGQSLGGPKVIYYLSKKQTEDIVGVIFASPADMVGLAKKTEPKYEELMQEASQSIRSNEPRKLLSSLVWDWYTLSAQTYLDLFSEAGPSDVLPLLRNPEKFPELASINKHIFAIFGEKDDVVIRSLPEDISLIQSRAESAESFSSYILPNADHVYTGEERAFSEKILEWITEKFKS